MKKKSIFLLVLALLVPEVYGNDCDLTSLLVKLRNELTSEFKNVKVNRKANELAKQLDEAGLGNYSYMARWELTKEAQRGPWAMKGNTLVVGVKKTDIKKWQTEVGDNSIGFGFVGHPNDAHPSAVLRIKDRIYQYYEIQSFSSAREFLGGGQQLKSFSASSTVFTESTFVLTPDEMESVIKFFSDRADSKILAKKKIKAKGRYASDVQPGDPIRPEFDYTSIGLTQESCMGACTSFVNPAWLNHYDMPESVKLATMASKYGIRPNPNAKAAIFDNFRNPNASSMTVIGLDAKSANDFVDNVSWKNTRGIMWAFIPDLAKTESTAVYRTQRVRLGDWLNAND